MTSQLFSMQIIQLLLSPITWKVNLPIHLELAEINFRKLYIIKDSATLITSKSQIRSYQVPEATITWSQSVMTQNPSDLKERLDMDQCLTLVHRQSKEEFLELELTRILYQLLTIRPVYTIITQSGTTLRLQDGIHPKPMVDSIDL